MGFFLGSNPKKKQLKFQSRPQKCKALCAMQEAWGAHIIHNTLECCRYGKKQASQEEFLIAVAVPLQAKNG